MVDTDTAIKAIEKEIQKELDEADAHSKKADELSGRIDRLIKTWENAIFEHQWDQVEIAKKETDNLMEKGRGMEEGVRPA